MGKIYFVPILLGLASAVLSAQVSTDGAFFGTVTDTTGSSVPGAVVAATHLGTGFSKQTATDTQGTFNLFALPIGKYSVTVKAHGFKTWQLAEVELTVGDRSRLSPELTVGEINESVAVTENAELLQTEKSSVESVVQLQQIRELPLDTRNPLALVALVPGMRYVSTQSGGERGTYVQGQGLRQNKTEFTLDGFISNAPMDEGGTGIPNVDAVAEFSVEMNFSAENGRDPMQVKVATKSGTNEFHGSAWEFQPERRLQRAEYLRPYHAARPLQPVWRRGGRTDFPEQDILLWQLSGDRGSQRPGLQPTGSDAGHGKGRFQLFATPHYRSL